MLKTYIHRKGAKRAKKTRKECLALVAERATEKEQLVELYCKAVHGSTHTCFTAPPFFPLRPLRLCGAFLK
jgi:hypothetical protein